MSDEIFRQAKLIAEDSLRQCYSKGKVLASLKNFSDYWARDTFWAMPGILAIGDWEIAKNSLDLFLSYQRENGDVPRKIALDWNAIKYVFKKSYPRSRPRPIYKGNIPLSNSKDENSLLLIAFDAYIKATGDIAYGKEKYVSLKETIDWYEKKMKNGFVREYLLSNWMDTIFKNGNVLYTNVLYCQALKSFSNIAEKIGQADDARIYSERHAEFKDKINEKFWNGDCYDDQLGKHRHFDTAGNVVACFFGIANQEKAEKIIAKLREIKKGKLLPTVFPKYPFWKVAPAAYVLGIGNYQNDISWLWIDMLAAAAKYKYGFKEEALEDFKNISQIIIKNKAVHETYFNNGEPYRRLLWESAVPFAWNSGIFLQVWEEMLM